MFKEVLVSVDKLSVGLDLSLEVIDLIRCILEEFGKEFVDICECL